MSIYVNPTLLASAKRRNVKEVDSLAMKEAYGLGCGFGLGSLLIRNLSLDVLACPDHIDQDQADCLLNKSKGIVNC